MFFSLVVSPVMNGDSPCCNSPQWHRGEWWRCGVTIHWAVFSYSKPHYWASRTSDCHTNIQSTNKDFCLVNLCAFLQLWLYLTHLFKIIPALKSIKNGKKLGVAWWCDDVIRCDGVSDVTHCGSVALCSRGGVRSDWCRCGVITSSHLITSHHHHHITPSHHT